jgi:hypothetical protein
VVRQQLGDKGHLMRLAFNSLLLRASAIALAFMTYAPTVVLASDYKWAGDAAETILQNSEIQGIEIADYYQAIVDGIRPVPVDFCTELPSVDRFANAITSLDSYREHSTALGDVFEEQGVEFAETARQIIIDSRCQVLPPVCG